MSSLALVSTGSALATTLPLIFFMSIASYVPLFISSIATYMKEMDFKSSGLHQASISTLNDDLYDFIVVGGGSAGAAVASRLSEKYQVLLIEAGGDPSPFSDIPFFSNMLVDQPLIDWRHQSCQTAVNSSGFVEQSCKKIPRGKCLGGSSILNWMVYMRGNPEDFNNWAVHSGDNRWSYANVERVFRKLEDYDGHWKDNGFHGVGGPMRIETTKYAPSVNSWLQAGIELGFAVNDPNGYQTEGFSPIDVTQKRGTRFSTYRGYIEPALKRQNLIIHRFSLATKIHFDVNMRAVGVEYLRHGIPKYAQVRKEIVVSGGAINSPQLLMLSGIGPREHLNYHEIPTLVDLPVGQNYQDHLSVIAGPFIFDKPVSFVPSRDLNWNALRDYIDNGTGPFSSTGLVVGSAFLSSSQAPKSWPDILIFALGNGPSSQVGQTLDELFSLPNKILENFYEKDDGRDGNIPVIMLARPKSRGEILLKDSNPLSSPLINPFKKYGDHIDDLSRLIEAVNYTASIYESTPAYAKLGARLSPRHLPGCEQFELRSYLYWECLIKLVSFSGFHPSSTCPMGKHGDPNAVVDSQLRVLGTFGLRVADASIMPFITNANLNAPSIMIGEMCAEMIVQDWDTFSK